MCVSALIVASVCGLCKAGQILSPSLKFSLLDFQAPVADVKIRCLSKITQLGSEDLGAALLKQQEKLKPSGEGILVT